MVEIKFVAGGKAFGWVRLAAYDADGRIWMKVSFVRTREDCVKAYDRVRYNEAGNPSETGNHLFMPQKLSRTLFRKAKEILC